jgi:hypothetical protein
VRTARVLVAVAALGVVVLVALAAALRLDDAAIDRHRAVAAATVLSVSPLRTGIEFVDATGLTIRPDGGVLYPGLLSPGQRFLVEYSTRDPTVVRVAGRTAAVGTVPLAGTAVVLLVATLPLAWWLRRRSGRSWLPSTGSRRTPP